METKMIKANPTREFFVNMLVRDILLKQAIIELIDNSIDGARTIKKDNDFTGLKIAVDFDGDSFCIRDNCGGIPLDVAQEYAFRFGRPKEKETGNNETTGIFGIGMKRALFKLGDYFEIKSKTVTTSFEVKLDVEQWENEESNNWDFPFFSYQENLCNSLESTGTTITVSRLRKEISADLKSRDFEKELIEHIQRRVGLDIDNGIIIEVNGKKLIGNHVKLVNGEDIQPVSDQNINYQIRPSKSIERKMMCELVKEIQIIQGTSELRYIGMGAKYFTDFLLFHNEFGVTDMISIEAERERAMRYEFNKPLKSIQMIYGTTNEVLPQIDQFEEKMNLVWLDYDGAFSEGMLSDIETLCRRLYVGSMFFISCNYSFAGKASEKRSAFEKSVGDYFEPDIEKSRYTNNGIPLIIQELINNLILKVLEKRNRSDSSRNVQYMQLLFLKYKDGAPMLTIGGIRVDDELKDRIINSNILQKLIYCSRDNECFNIEVPKLTYKEIQLVLREIPITDKEYEENKERFHGIGLDEIRKFEKIYRYYPYYTEGCLNTYSSK